jgi:hypothetical protein
LIAAANAPLDGAYVSTIDVGFIRQELLRQVTGAVTWVGLEIIDKFAKVLDVELTEFFRPPTPSAKRQR